MPSGSASVTSWEPLVGHPEIGCWTKGFSHVVLATQFSSLWMSTNKIIKLEQLKSCLVEGAVMEAWFIVKYLLPLPALGTSVNCWAHCRCILQLKTTMGMTPARFSAFPVSPTSW